MLKEKRKLEAMMKLRTVCEREIWSGFFGIDEYGTQPECGQEIEIEVEEDCIINDKYGIRPSFSVECPKCHGTIAWPQQWEVVENDNDNK